MRLSIVVAAFGLTIGLSLSNSAGDKLSLDREFGIKACDLQNYSWQAISPEDSIRPGLLQTAKKWAELAVTPEYAPPSDAVLSVHRGNETSCDALRISYVKNSYTISIAQTRWIMLIEIEGADTRVSDMQGAPVLAERVLDKMVRQIEKNEEIELTTDKTVSGLALGTQKLKPSVTRGRTSEILGQRGFSVIHWWYDGNRVSFLGLKNLEEGSAATPSIGIEQNRHWFSDQLPTRKRN